MWQYRGLLVKERQSIRRERAVKQSGCLGRVKIERMDFAQTRRIEEVGAAWVLVLVVDLEKQAR